MKVLLVFLSAFVCTATFSQTEVSVDSADLDGSTFVKVDVEATYPGGIQGWRRFLEKNLNANVPVDNGAPIGIYTVIAQFIVDKNGNLSDIKTLTNFGYGMEQEVIRILKTSTQWIPAKQNERVVRAYRKQPVTFVIEDESIEIVMDEPYTLYIGNDNKIKIKVAKVKTEDLELSLTHGTIQPDGNGNLIIQVSKPGKSILNISRKNRSLGSVYFIVKKKS